MNLAKARISRLVLILAYGVRKWIQAIFTRTDCESTGTAEQVSLRGFLVKCHAFLLVR